MDQTILNQFQPKQEIELRKGSKIELIIFAEFSAKGSVRAGHFAPPEL